VTYSVLGYCVAKRHFYDSAVLRPSDWIQNLLCFCSNLLCFAHNPIMIASRVVRTGAVIGVIGGGLRAAGSFASRLVVSDDMRTWLYVAIDIGLAVGLLSIYVARRHGMRAAGTIGSFLALGGLIAGRISPAVTDLDLYPVTASAVVIGLLVLAFSEWRMGRMVAWIPLTFALSLVVGSIGTFVAGVGALFILSGILFGSAFCAMAITAY
jgi:hypothetical protein